jgi:3-methyladenine DNA glycosylase Mpg
MSLGKAGYSDSRCDHLMLAADFFDRPADVVAHDLIGQRLCWRVGGQTHIRIITETEGYLGPEDLASHAANGRRTKRNEPMFGPPSLGNEPCHPWAKAPS